MAKSRTSKPSSRGTSSNDVDLIRRLRLEFADAPIDQPLPTTREYGQRLGVANTTAFRALQKLTQDGEIWQHPVSGRYYPAAAQALLNRPQPMACLIRRLELASEQYRELLEGVSQGCGALHRTMLLWHDELLVNHPDPHLPPIFASVAQQRAILSTFLERHSQNAGSFLLDHLWSDEALRTHASRLTPAVVPYRTCTLPGFSNVRADFRSGAFKALTHLLARGFSEIIPIEPFANDPAVTEFLQALEKASDESGCRDRLSSTVAVHTHEQRLSLLDRLRKTSHRVAVVSPEDNISLLLVTLLKEAGISCPDQVGVLSVMGTDYATKAGVSCLRYDFRMMGRLAVEALAGRGVVQHSLEPQLHLGST